MGAPILRQKTVGLLRECVLIAEEMHLFGLSDALKNTGLVDEKSLGDPYKARFAFDGILKAINWCDRDSIMLVLPIFEDAYAESPVAQHTIHQKLDSELAQDGFQIKEGRLIKIMRKEENGNGRRSL